MKTSFTGIAKYLAVLAIGVPLAAVGQAMDNLAVPVCVNGHCGVVDQDGKTLLPFENKYGAIYSNRPGNSVVVAMPKARDGVWRLVAADGKTTLKGPFDELRLLTPGYYGMGKGGKLGIIDHQGNEILPIRFDDLSTIGDPGNQYISYEIGGKQGILNAAGEKITEAVYSDVFMPLGHLVMAQRDGQPWIINLETKAEQAVPYDYLTKPFADGVMISEHLKNRTRGLVDANGKELIRQSEYQWLGSAGNGYVAFRKQYDDPCGYMDYSGKVVIKPQFAKCEAFGKLGAMVQVRAAEGKTGQYGLIGRQGQWLLSPRYDMAEQAELGLIGQAHVRDVPGYAVIGRRKNADALDYGVFSTDEGKEVLAAQYPLIGVLKPDLFAYGDDKAPKVNVTFMGSMESMPSVGLMDRTGKPLAKPQNFMGFTRDPSGRFIRAHEGTAVNSRTALFDLHGIQVIAPEWQEIEVNVERGYITANEVFLDENNRPQSELRALYDLTGRAVFTVKTLSCGAEQVVDGAGRPIWPANAATYCPKKKKKQR